MVKSGVPKRTQFTFVCPFCRWMLLLRDLYVVNILFNLEVSCWSGSVFTLAPRNPSVRHLDSGRFSFLRQSITSIIMPWVSSEGGVNFSSWSGFRRWCLKTWFFVKWGRTFLPAIQIPTLTERKALKICTTILAFSSFLHDSFCFTLQANALQRVVSSDVWEVAAYCFTLKKIDDFFSSCWKKRIFPLHSAVLPPRMNTAAHSSHQLSADAEMLCCRLAIHNNSLR